MKMKRFLASAICVACVIMLAIPTFARVSSQIKNYTIDATAKTGAIEVYFYVAATNTMSEIGCESIKVYDESGSSWSLVESWDEYDSGMSKSNERIFSDTVSCDSEKGVEYKVVITVFADDGSDRDTRTRTIYVTGK